jgi:uncharacterized Zn-finger protein
MLRLRGKGHALPYEFKSNSSDLVSAIMLGRGASTLQCKLFREPRLRRVVFLAMSTGPNNGDENNLRCPHCDALYLLGATNPHPTPVACRQCGRLMYDGRRVLKPAKS